MIKTNMIGACVLSLLSATVAAEAVSLACEGVNFVYPAGIGRGPAQREKSSRAISLDLSAMEVAVVEKNGAKPAQLRREDGTYHAFFPREVLVSGAPVTGEQLEVDLKGLWVEMRYILPDRRRFLSFTGQCRR